MKFFYRHILGKICNKVITKHHHILTMVVFSNHLIIHYLVKSKFSKINIITINTYAKTYHIISYISYIFLLIFFIKYRRILQILSLLDPANNLQQTRMT